MAPPSHQHADDTTVHTKTPEGAAVALQLAVVPLGRASGARVNVAKSLGLLLGGVDSEELREQAQAVVGVPFVAPGDHTRHLGVLLSARDVESAAKAMFAKRRAGVFLRVRSWARFEKKKYYHHWRLLKGEVQFSGMPLPVPLPTVRPCAQSRQHGMCHGRVSRCHVFWHCAHVPI
jgi:hypothetical protein